MEVLPKLRSLESILQPINRLPMDVFVLIPRFTREEERLQFVPPTNKPLITMTHVCRSWRNTLLSTPSLWTQIDFSLSAKSQQAEVFLRRSGNQLLDIYHHLRGRDYVEPFLSTMLHNLFRLRGLSIVSYLPYLEPLLRKFSALAPELKYLEIQSGSTMEPGAQLPNVFGGQMPKLTSLSLYLFHTNLCYLDLPSLTRFSFVTKKYTSIRRLIFFLERCPLLEFVEIRLSDPLQAPTPPPRRRVCLAALRELRLDITAYTTGLLDQLILPKCTEMMLKGRSTDGTLIRRGTPVAQIHPSSIDHLPVTRGITKAVAIGGSCTFSGPSGNLSFWWSREIRESVDAHFFTSFFPVSLLQIRELLIGHGRWTRFGRAWKRVAAGLRGAFEVLTDLEGLTIVHCKMEPFLQTLGETVDGRILLPELQRLTVYVWCGDMDVSALIQCTRSRKEHFRPLEEVTVVWEKDPGAVVRDEVESLREFVGELTHRVGEAPKLFWRGDECGWRS